MRVRIATGVLTALLSIGMLSQNVVAVYAAEAGDGAPENSGEVTITYTVNDSEMGEVSLESETVTAETVATELKGSTASAKDGYVFVNWQDAEGTVQGSDATFLPSSVPTEDVTYTAYFAADQSDDDDDDDEGDAGANGIPQNEGKGSDVIPQNEGNGVNPQNEGDGASNDAVPTVADGKAYVVSTATEYETLDAAMEAAASTDTIYLGKGTYRGSSDANKGKGAGKNLTFIGAGKSDTVWQILDNGFRNSGDGYCDYSLDNRGAASPVTVTFENMAMVSSINIGSGTFKQYNRGDSYLRGLVGIDNLVLRNCEFNGIAGYWGYTSTEFDNVTFNAPGTDQAAKYGIYVSYSYWGIPQTYDYSVWTYTGSSYTFDGCTFNSKGRQVNVFSYNGSACTINYKDCTVNANVGSGWTDSMFATSVLNIDDSSRTYHVNISGDNIVKGLDPNYNTCSRLFQVKGSKAVVSMGDTVVWTNGAMVNHEMDIHSGSYDNGKAEGTANQYTEGYKDNKYTVTEGEWIDMGNGVQVREIIKTCDYCGWSNKDEEQKDKQVNTIDKNLPADLKVNANTESDQVYKVRQGQKIELTGALQVSEVLNQMNLMELVFNNDGSNVNLEDIDYSFTAKLTIPDGMTLPDISSVGLKDAGLASTFKTDGGTVSDDGKSVTVVFSLTDEAKAAIKTYTELKNYVSASVNANNGWLEVTIPDVQIDGSVAPGTQLTVKGEVSGKFSATAVSQYNTHYNFAFNWTGTQWAEGKDAVAEDDTSIQLTVEVTALEEPDKPHHHHDKDSKVTPNKTTVTPTETPVTPVTPTETAPVEQPTTPTPTTQAVTTTGDDSNMMLYGVVMLAAVAALAGWTRKTHVR